MSTLHVYDCGNDTVIAFSPSDASAVFFEHSGETREDYPDLDDKWIKIKPNRVLRIVNYRGDGAVVEMTAAEFIADNGRGFLCSTEY